MGKKYKEIEKPLQKFIEQQNIFFVATAAPDGRVNVSPKGLDSLRILRKNRVAWLNLTGSGNETAAHVLESDRMTIMFCAFEGKPMIMRLYGHVTAVHPRDKNWGEFIAYFPAHAGARQIFDMQVDLVQTSCGSGVPLFDYAGERDQLQSWSEKKGTAELEKYWEEKNQISLDGKPTKIL